MHEFSIAMNIVEIAEVEAEKAKANEIKELILEIGTMAGIEFYALDTALEAAVNHTKLENANVKINKIQALAKCKDCNTVFEIDNVFDPCPKCQSLYHDLICGKELQIKSLVVNVD